MTITDGDMRRQVTEVLRAGERPQDFDVTGIVDELIGRFGLVNVDTIDNAAFWGVVAAYDTTSKTPPAPAAPRTILAEDLAAIPAEHRRTIALWLTQVAESHTGGWVISAAEAALIRNVLLGAAVDLADPTSEDTTVEHAAAILGELTNPSYYGCADCSFATADILRSAGHVRATGHAQRVNTRIPEAAARQGAECSDLGAGPR